MSSKFCAGVAALALSIMSLTAVPTAMAGSKPDDKGAEAEVKGVGPEATKAAKRAAIAEWKQEVAKDGNTPDWRTATEKKVKCKSSRTETECEVEARPAH
jgi:hypothetical protein